jgi:hypothetical protein
LVCAAEREPLKITHSFTSPLTLVAATVKSAEVLVQFAKAVVMAALVVPTPQE